MDEGLLSALGQGFSGMGAVVSPEVAQRQAEERARQQTIAQQLFLANRQMVADAIQRGALPAESGAGLGLPGGLGPDAQTQERLLRLKAEQEASKRAEPFLLKNDYKGALAAISGVPGGLNTEIANRLATVVNRTSQAPRISIDPTKYTAESLKSYSASGNIGDLVATDKPQKGGIRLSISPKDYTTESLKLYSKSGDIGDLVPTKQPSSDPTKGWTFYKDKDNNLFRFNPNAGLVEKKTAAGEWEQSDQLPDGLTKIGNLLGGGALNARFSGRVIGAANEGLAAINSIAKLTDPQSGLFSSRGMRGAEGKNVVAGLFTPERTKRYNATIAGLANEIATAQNQGMAPHDEQIKAVREAITIGPTDDDVTKRYKVALAARYIRKGLEVSMDLATPDQKKRAEGLLKQMEKIPDPDDIETDNKGPGMFPASGPSKDVPGSAPQAAIDYLKANPNTKDAFKAKYGYLPNGF